MPRSPRLSGVALVLVASLGFAGMALWAKDAYAHGWSPAALIAVRFVLVAAAFWTLHALRGGLRRRLPLRPALTALTLGMTCYTLENTLFFGAVARLDAGLASLVMSVYPAVVVAGAVVLRRERADAGRIGALALALGGTLLVLSSGAGGGFDAAGVAMALGAATAYATYLLCGDALLRALDPFALAALASSGAAISLTGAAVLSGHTTVPGTGAAWLDLAGLVVTASIIPLATLWHGVARIGAPTASIVASVEPALTVTLAALLLGEHLSDHELLGGLLVVAAVVFINARPGGRVEGDEPAVDAHGPAPAGALAHEPA